MGAVETMVLNSGVSNTGSEHPMMPTSGCDISMMPFLASNTMFPNRTGMGCMFPEGSDSDWMHSNSFITTDSNYHKMFHDPVLNNNVFSSSGDYLFSMPEPVGTVLQCHQGIGCTSMGTTNQMMPMIGVQGIRSQMIPTSGIGGSQFAWIKTVPQQFTGGTNRNVCCNMSGKTGGAMGGINLRPRNSSHGFINCGVQLAGNNQHFMNTTTLSNPRGYLNASEDRNSQESFCQNVTQLHQCHLLQSARVSQMAPLAGESYAMNTAERTGSGNFYGPAPSGALLTTTSLDGESLGLVSRKSIPVAGLPTWQHQQKEHGQQGQQLSVERSGELHNQPALTVFGKNQGDTETPQGGALKKEFPGQKQLPSEQWQFTVNDPLLQQNEAWNDFSLYTHHINPEHSQNSHKLQVLSSQEQQRTQSNNVYNNHFAQVKPEVSLQGDQDLQSQKKVHLPRQFSSFIEQPQPPQQGQPQVYQDITWQHQMSQQILGNDPLIQQNEAWNDNSLYSQQVKQEQSEKLRNLQVLSSQEQQITQTDNVYNNLSAQVNPEVSLQGDQELQSQKKLQLPQQYSSFIEQPQPPQQEPPQVDQDIIWQHQMSQQILGNDIASTTISHARCGTIGDTVGNVQPSLSAAKQKMQFVVRKNLLLYFYHASKCSALGCQCRTGTYTAKHKLWAHITTCHDRQCIYPYCCASWTLIRHHQRCSDKCCPVCGPIRQLIIKHLANKVAWSSNPGAAEFVNGVPNSSNFNSSVGTNINLVENYRASVLETTQDEQPPIKRRKIKPASPSCSWQEVRSTFVSARIPSEMQGLTQKQTYPSGHESGTLKSDSLKSILVTSMHDRTQDKQPPIKWKKIGPPSRCAQQEVESMMVSMRSPSEMEVPTQIQTQLFHSSGHDSIMMKSDLLKTAKEKPALVTVEPSVTSQGPCQKNFVFNNDTFWTFHAVHGQPHEKLNKAELAISLSANVPKQVEQETMQVKQEPIMNVSAPDSSASVNFGKPMNPKVKGVSLTELFTLEQIRDHIIGLRKWAGKSNKMAETHQFMESEMSDEACQLCKLEKLTFDPPPIYCSLCPSRIKPNASCYRVAADDRRHRICIPCYNKIRCDTVEIDGNAFAKSKLVKEKNEEVGTEEVWVSCDICKKWQHNICALFNGKRNEVEPAEYMCPNCYTEQIKMAILKPLPQSAILGAKDLPTTCMSDHIERRLCRQLEQERNERAKALGKSFEEVPGADGLVVRVVSSVDKILKVKQRFLENIQCEDYPTEFPYKSKVVLLFQKIEGVEVCIFGMYVQEYGSECSHPNQRRIYLSYLDSVKYFRPDVKTVTGEALRTFVFHEILIGYLEYSKRRGFVSCYIWVCPPSDGDDYILYCHPEIQKTPNPNKLREWYLMMLRKASKEDIVLDVTNLYEFFFVSTGERKAKVTAARLPYFDGDCWPGAAEKVIMQFQQEKKKERKYQKTNKYTTRRSSKAAAPSEFDSGSSKDGLLMKKYRDTIRWSKENFIMVHLQHACTHCCLLIVSGKRWVCKQCKNFQLCDKCYESEQKLEQKQKHPIKSVEKHTLFPIDVTDVPEDTKDKDDIMECEFFDTRHAFLSLCQENHYQYDTLRRAKHSSMMVLYHLHNQTTPPHSFVADRDAQNQDAGEHAVQKLQKIADSVKHASKCVSPQCAYQNCQNLKRLFRHGMNCKIGDAQGCIPCRKMWYVLQLHARACKESECCVHRCKDLKNDMRRSQKQMET